MVLEVSTEIPLRKELERGERLLWSGMPRQGFRFRPGDLFVVPFRNKGPTIAIIWGLPFVLIGIYLIIGRFFLDSYLRSGTFYGVTNRRVVIVNGIWTRETKSIDLQRLSEVSLTERPDGSGSIYFGPVPPFSYSAWYGTPGSA